MVTRWPHAFPAGFVTRSPDQNGLPETPLPSTLATIVRSTLSAATYSSSLMPWWTTARTSVASSRSRALAASPASVRCRRCPSSIRTHSRWSNWSTTLAISVTDPNRSGVGLPPSVQDTGVVSIGSTGALLRAHRCDTPKAVVVSADQGSEACGGIEARKAEPVDRPILGDHGSAFEVSYKGVVLDWFTHNRNTPSNTSRSLHFTASHAFAHPPTDRPARPQRGVRRRLPHR